MESVLTISGLAQIINFIGAPILLGAALLATVLLTGAAERIVNFVDEASFPTSSHRLGDRESE